MTVSVITQIVFEDHVLDLDAFRVDGTLYAAWTVPASAIPGRRALQWRNHAGAVGTEIRASLAAPYLRFTAHPVVSQNALLVVWQDDDSGTPELITARFDLTTGALLTGPTTISAGSRPKLSEVPGGADTDPALTYVDVARDAIYMRHTTDGGVTWSVPYPILNQKVRETTDLSVVGYDSGHLAVAQLGSDARRLREVGHYERTRPVAGIIAHPSITDAVLAVESSARDVLSVAQLSDNIRGAILALAVDEVVVPTRKRLGTNDGVGDLFSLDVSGNTPALLGSVAIPAGAVAGDGVCRVALPGLTVNTTVSPIFNASAAPNAAPVAFASDGSVLAIAGYSDATDAGILALMNLGTNVVTHQSVTGLARAVSRAVGLAAVARSSAGGTGHALLFGAAFASVTTYVHKLPSRPQAIAIQMDSATSGQIVVALADRLNVYQMDALASPIRLVYSVPIFTRGAMMQVVILPNGNLLCAMGEGGVSVLNPTGEILAQTLASGIYARPWTPSTSVVLGDLVSPGPNHPYAPQRRYFRMTAASGTTGSVEPAWGPSGTINDGTATWTEVGPTSGIVCAVTYSATRRRVYAAGVVGGTSGVGGRVWAFETEGLFSVV